MLNGYALSKQGLLALHNLEQGVGMSSQLDL
jgi:hypothetical protein